MLKEELTTYMLYTLLEKKINKLFKILNNPELTGESLTCCLKIKQIKVVYILNT